MDLPKTARLIEDSVDYIDIDGSVWSRDTRKGHKGYQRWYKKAQYKNHGYSYCGIYRISQHKCVSMRVHKLVARAFILNSDPEHKTVVAHRNNIKDDNRVENLFWATPAENIQQAVDDGLLVNDKSWDDSQSIHVVEFNTYTNEIIREFGSICEAHAATGISKSTITRQCKYKRPVRKPVYFRYSDDPDAEPAPVVFGYDMKTDQLVGIYYNTNDASNQTHIHPRVVCQDIKNGRKPVFTQSRKVYFSSKQIRA